ncbi:MAG: DNA polymerase III subunit gamma/tau [Candidatus Saccharibacteria bacterium]
MAQVLYRKYRSKNLSEIVGQEHITKTLSEALKSGRISHAYLFTGPRGVGKTSIARILAHEVNGLPYSDDQPHIDIIEIDAASNRRIDEIRDLRDKVHISPASAKYKVYIIDEVHMLTKEAFNALLKTLEEPPAHVIFILATTDPHKLPDTIISRTQHFSFKPIDNISAVDHLKSIAKSENIKINDKALQLIAEHGEGSFRDSISLLDQLGNGSSEITDDDVRRILGIPSAEAIDRLVELIDGPKTSYKELSDQLNTLLNQGFSPALLTKRLMNELRDKLINNQLNMSASRAVDLLKELLNVGSASDPSSYLLLTLINSLPSNPATAVVPTQVKTMEPVLAKSEPAKPIGEEARPEPEPEPEVKEAHNKKPSKKMKVSDDLWPEVLNELKKHNTLYGIIRMAKPVFKENNQLDLIFDFAFHKKQVSESKNKQIISDVLTNLTGQNFHIECLLNESPEKIKPIDIKPKDTQELNAISKIFGGGELVD